MSEHTSSRSKSVYPEVLMNLLATPRLMADEDLKDFNLLFDSLLEYLDPPTDWHYLVTYQAAMLTLDILRYHAMKVGVLRNHQRPAFESLIRKVLRGATSDESKVKVEVDQLATQWFSDPASRPAILEKFEKAGYSSNAVEVEAFQLALPILAPIERLIVPAQKRLDQYLKGLEKASKASAQALRSATAKAVEAHASGRLLA